MKTKLAIPQHLAFRAAMIGDEYRRRGIHILGMSGTGKTLLLSKVLAFYDFVRGIPTIIIDPVGGAINGLLDSIARCPPEVQPELWERVRYVDMNGRAGNVMGSSLYFSFGDESLHQIAARFVDFVRRIDPFLEEAPMQGMNALRPVALHVGMTLSALGLQITEAPALLANHEPYMNRLQSLKYSFEYGEIIRYFKHEYSRQQTVSFRNKLYDILLNPVNRAMFGASNPGIDWNEVVSRRLCVLIDLSTETDEYMQRFKMIWMFYTILTYIKKKGYTRKTPISLFIDELAEMYHMSADETFEKDIETLASFKGRNYGVWSTLSHQEQFQFEERTRKSLLSMGTQIIGQTSDPDAAMQYARLYDHYQPYLEKDEKRIWGSTSLGEMGSYHHVIDTQSITFTPLEQLLLATRKYLDLSPFHFLVKPAGVNALRKLSIEGVVPRNPTPIEKIERIKDVLMKKYGTPIESDTLLDYEAPRYDIPASKTDNTAKTGSDNKRDDDFEVRKRRFISDDE